VKGLAEKYHCEMMAKRFDTNKYAEEKKISIQVAARELRYHWFQEILESIPSANGAKWIVTAHHLDDNIETVLMNFFKGTGVSGLRGMLPKSGKIVRPLLFARKDELVGFAKENNLQWVEDSSNESDKYSRNYLRHHLIPLIESLYPSAIENLQNNISRFGEIEKLYEQAVQFQLKKLIEKKGEEVHIPILKLKKMASPKSLIYELISPLGFTPVRVEEVMELLDAETGRYLLSDTHRILKNRNWLVISPLQVELQEQVLVEEKQKEISFQQGKLELKVKPAAELQLSPHNGTALLDANKIMYPLILRKWKQGDYFYPLGMRKKKKLARFFIDQKLSLAQKEKVWVMEMDKKILWVVGMRIDDRFKITPDTKEVLQIRFEQ
jgi:tRNA(Ile)-lysidine synthase